MLNKMRKINKDFNNAPKELQNCANKNEQNLLETKKINSDCYKQSKKELEKQFHGKCAYCETKYTEYTQIEHYRPKSIYYWLAYEWSNLLPSCTKCNTKKGNKFPLINKSKKVKIPPLQGNKKINRNQCKADSFPLIDENPYLLHAKIDNSKEYFSFEIDKNYKGIEIIGLDEEGKSDLQKEYSGKADATIRICDLNRAELKKDRYQKVIREIVKSFELVLKILIITEAPLSKYYKVFKSIFENITEKSIDANLEHTLLRTVLLDIQKFDAIIGSSIENNENFKEYIIKAYTKYYQENK